MRPLESTLPPLERSVKVKGGFKEREFHDGQRIYMLSFAITGADLQASQRQNLPGRDVVIVGPVRVVPLKVVMWQIRWR